MIRSVPRTVIGIGIVFNQIGEILIDQRLDGKSMGGLWEFPGGKQELNEDIEETISREIFEELGIKIKVGKELLSFDYSYSYKKLHFVVHLCELISGEPKSFASQKFLWVYPKYVVNYSFPAANIHIFSALFKELGLEI